MNCVLGLKLYMYIGNENELLFWFYMAVNFFLSRVFLEEEFLFIGLPKVILNTLMKELK